jgi:hypothetical protein
MNMNKPENNKEQRGFEAGNQKPGQRAGAQGDRANADKKDRQDKSAEGERSGSRSADKRSN